MEIDCLGEELSVGSELFFDGLEMDLMFLEILFQGLKDDEMFFSFDIVSFVFLMSEESIILKLNFCEKLNQYLVFKNIEFVF